MTVLIIYTLIGETKTWIKKYLIQIIDCDFVPGQVFIFILFLMLGISWIFYFYFIL